MILNVCLTCRDRNILTQKTIESIHENTKLFDKIKIYCFDNYSELDSERIEIFSNLLKDKKIHYYSYDTAESTNNHFPKAVIFNRWIDMVELESKLNDEETYYLLIDNDMILCPNWDEYFLSSVKLDLGVFFFVPYPSGIRGVMTPSGVKKREIITVKSMFNKEYKIITSQKGGSSGMWFMSKEQLNKLKWNKENFDETKDSFKKHDVTTWKKLRKEYGENYKYVAAIQTISPLVLHLGDAFGSICVPANRNQYHQNLKTKYKENEKVLKNMSIESIIEKYGEVLREW